MFTTSSLRGDPGRSSLPPHFGGFRVRVLILGLSLLVFLAAASGCGRERPSDEPVAEEEISEQEAFQPLGEEALTGKVRADGSSTLAPFVSLAAERFRKKNPDVQVSVGVAGTGGGLERFCRGETDLSNASRPIEDEEREACEKRRIRFIELQVANDGLSVVVSPENDWAKCLTVDQLKRIWQPNSRVDSWNDVDSSFPDEELALAGPGTDSGTFDYFTDVIVGEEGASRTDYTATEDDNVIVNAVAGEKGGLGYLGLSYFEQNQKRLRAVDVDGGDGCVAPSVETVQSGEYKPLSRPLFIYVNRVRLDEKLEVDAFLEFILSNQRQIAKGALFVPLTEEQLSRSQTALEGASPE
jgi:phosphate transport system substrate-binding protein